MSLSKLDQEAVDCFKEYLRIESVQPTPDYERCGAWVRRQAARLGLPVRETRVRGGAAPVLVVSWEGERPRLPTLLLSSHMDVVPVFPELWSRPPFGAEQDADGRVFGRGAQDMKCVGVQYLEAVRRLRAAGFRPRRTVHICFTPDEEIGTLGMQDFVRTEDFRQLNVGCALDEGVASPDESFVLFYGERTNCSFSVTCTGTPGHGSIMYENTAGEKICRVISSFMQKRTEEMNKLKDKTKSLGDVTAINLTKLEGGIQTNVVPPELKVTFDCRVSLDMPIEEFEMWAEEVCAKSGEGVMLQKLSDMVKVEPTRLDEGNPWWGALRSQFDKLGLNVRPMVCPACSDARHIRNLGIPAFGFSPMNNTPILLHEHDEFLNVNVFLKGIEIYEQLITALSHVYLLKQLSAYK